MKEYRTFSLTRLTNSFSYAFSGLFRLFRQEKNAKIHACAAILALFFSFFLRISKVEWCIIILCIVLVIALEAINSALESLSDLVSPEYHEKIKWTKDFAASAVLLAAMGTFVCGVIIFLPKLLKYFF